MPDRLSFAKNRHGCFAKGDVLRSVFEMVVRRCIEAGLVGGEGALIDGSNVEADASRHRRAAPDEVAEAWADPGAVTRPVQAYLDQFEAEAAEPHEGPAHKPPKTVSLTDLQSAWSVKFT